MRFSRLVKPGGRLVYATCAIGRTENEEIAAFVASELGEFSPAPLSGLLGSDLAAKLGADGHLLKLLPHRHGTDGFFIAAFRRTQGHGSP
jgi:16S rRNA (cytosine967-C5)-methyltransferase